jgi:hypothetical protein
MVPDQRSQQRIMTDGAREQMDQDATGAQRARASGGNSSHKTRTSLPLLQEST